MLLSSLRDSGVYWFHQLDGMGLTLNELYRLTYLCNMIEKSINTIVQISSVLKYPICLATIKLRRMKHEK